MRGAIATAAPRAAHLRAGAALLGLAAGLAGCQPFIQGNGVYYEEARTGLAAFSAVTVDSGVEAVVTAGASSPRVVVSGDANVVPHLETEVRTEGERQVLHVWVSSTYAGTIPPRATISVPALERVTLAHASRLDARALGTDALELTAAAGSAAVLEAAAGAAASAMVLTLSGGATLDATAYPVSGQTAVALSDGSAARLHADGPVSGTVSGGSRLDGLAGAGSCAAVVADASSQVSCR